MEPMKLKSSDANGIEFQTDVNSTDVNLNVNKFHSDFPSDSQEKPLKGKPKAFDFWSYDVVKETSDWLKERTSHVAPPEVGIVCGSGCGGIADGLKEKVSFDFQDIPHFMSTSIPGHEGRLVFGHIGGKSVVAMQGRYHAYEGYQYGECAFPIRVMKLMGAHTLIITNATGGLNPDYEVGDLMVVKDHLSLPSLCGLNPLKGPNDERLGPRFVPLNHAYDRELRSVATEAARQLHLSHILRHGNLVHVSGPNYESPFECRFLRLIGGDAVGMSAAHECLVARHMDMRVLAIALITNKAILDADDEKVTNHEEILESGKISGTNLKSLIAEVISKS